MFNTIKSNHPDAETIEVYHLAAQSHVKVSFDNPIYTTQCIVLGTQNGEVL